MSLGNLLGAKTGQFHFGSNCGGLIGKIGLTGSLSPEYDKLHGHDGLEPDR